LENEQCSVYLHIENKILSEMGISDRKAREKAEMKRMILNAALDLFSNEGYESVSIRKIAEKIEYSPSSLYNYFEDKTAILLELLKEGFNVLYQKQLSVQAIPDPVDRLIEHGRAYMEFAIKYPYYYDLMFIMRDPVENIEFKKFDDIGVESLQLIINNVEDCKAHGFFKNQNAYLLAFYFWSTVHGLISLKIRKRLAISLFEDSGNNNLQDKILELIRVFVKSQI